jgi:hypothetical protein
MFNDRPPQRVGKSRKMVFMRKKEQGHPSQIAFPMAPDMNETPKEQNKKNQDKEKIQMKDKPEKQGTDKNQKILWQ